MGAVSGSLNMSLRLVEELTASPSGGGSKRFQAVPDIKTFKLFLT